MREALKKSTLWIVVGGLILGAAAIAASFISVQREKARLLSEERGSTPPGSKELGSPTAPVVVEIWSDFQCPYCALAARNLKSIEEKYVKTGRVRIIYRHFPFIGEESRWAAEASECAAAQGKFWIYHDLLFANQKGENQGNFLPGRLRELARQAGLDEEEFKRCFQEERYSSLVAEEFSQGRARGIRATPTFFINGQMIEGALTPEQLRQIFEEILGKSAKPS